MRALILLPLLIPAAALAAPKVSPGQWQSTTTIESASMPGVPPQALTMMTGRATTVSYCLTPEEAEADPKKMLGADKSCSIDKFDLEDGKLDAVMRCKGDQGPAVMTMNGTYADTSYTMKSTIQSGPMTMVSTTTAKRLGPCK